MNFIKRFNNKPDLIFYLIIFSFIFLIRFPFFFIDFLDSDEATLILKGLAITQGKIPYLDFHNFKPPLSGYFLTLPIYIADNSLLAIRIFTAFVIFGSCSFLFKITNLYNFTKSNSLITSLIFGITVSFITRSIKSQSFYSEHISVLLILITFYLFLKSLEKRNNLYFILQGFFLGIATLNTPYLAFFSIIFCTFPLLFYQEKFKKKFTCLINIILGGLIPLIIFLSYFYLKFNNIILYTLEAALSDHTSNEIFSLFRTIYLLIGAGVQINSIKFFSAFFIWVFGFFGLLHIIFTKNFENKNLILISSIITLSISIILIGYPSGRYLIIVAPFYCISLTYFLNIVIFKKIKYLKIIILCCIFLFPLNDWYKNILVLKNTNLNKKTLSYGTCTDLYRFLKNKNLLNKNIYFHDCHIVKFFINKLPILDFYHPSDIFKTSRMKAFKNSNTGDVLFEKNPDILILPENLNKFMSRLMFTDINSKSLESSYIYLFKKYNFYIYQYEK